MKVKTLTTLFFFFLLLPPLVLSIGVSPARYEVDFEPGLTKEFSFEVVNNAGYPLEASISADGDLAQYVTFSTRTLPLKEEPRGTFTATLTLPDVIEQPGRHIIRITIVESPDKTVGMVARTAVIPWIIVHVPYPGKYAEIKSFTVAEGKRGVNEGENTPISFSIINRGKEDITGSTATIYLKEDNGEIIDRVKYDDITIRGGDTYTKNLELTTNTLLPGDYKAQLVYEYEDKTLEQEKSFTVGTFDVVMTDYPHEVIKKGIVPFEITVRNMWKGDVYAEAVVNIEGTREAKTPRERFGSFAQHKLIAYLDTEPLSLGEHTGEVQLLFAKNRGADRMNTKTYPVTFTLVKEEEPVTETPKNTGINTLIIILIALIILLIIASTITIDILIKHKKKR